MRLHSRVKIPHPFFCVFLGVAVAQWQSSGLWSRRSEFDSQWSPLRRCMSHFASLAHLDQSTGLRSRG